MAPARFQRLALRTTDVAAGGAFYRDLLDGSILEDEGVVHLQLTGGRIGPLVPLPDPARVRGAPAHWLGGIGVDDVSEVVHRIVRAGGRRLGLPGVEPDGRPEAVVRDPGGAVLAVVGRSPDPAPDLITWRELHTPSPEGMWAMYRDLFGWTETERIELPPPIGSYRIFSWGERAAGGIVDTRRRPGIHPHWSYYLPISDLDAAVDRIEALGGARVAGPDPGPMGRHIAVGEDPQGALFALTEADALPSNPEPAQPERHS